MARFAQAGITNNNPQINIGDSIAITINGVTTTWIASEFANRQSRYFPNTNQYVANQELYEQLKIFLEPLGYEVILTNPDLNVYSFTIRAKLYGEAYNITSVVCTGAYASGAVILDNINPPAATYTTQQATCYGSSTGSVVLDVTGGTGPYTYAWDDDPEVTVPNRYMLPAGEYWVTVRDSAKSEWVLNEQGWPTHMSNEHQGVVRLQVIIGQNAQLQVIGQVGNNSIELQVSGGTFPYTYKWADGPTSRNRYDISSGSYTCTIRDALGCTRTVTFSISLERFFFSKNPVPLELQAMDLEQKPNLRFVCEVWVEPEYLSGDFILATPDAFEHPADAEGKTQFDVSEILNAFVEPHLPDFNQTIVKRADKAFKRFFLRYTEAYGEPLTLEPFTVQDNRYVICGGLDAPEHFTNTFFASFLPNRKPFFTWEPVIKTVLREQPEYLYFMPNSFELQDFRVMVRVSFADGSISTFQAFQQGDIKRFELYSIPVGYEQLNLANLQPGKQVRHWEVYVLDNLNNAISETRRFVLDKRHYAQVRYFLYANSLGGYNTLAATGRGKFTVDAQAQVMEREIPANALSGDTVTLSKYSKRTLQLTTGHKTKAELEALQDFLNSEDVKLVGDDRYIPGRLSDKSAEIYDDKDPLNGISFDFILPKMYSYTPTLQLAGYADESHLLTPLQP